MYAKNVTTPCQIFPVFLNLLLFERFCVVLRDKGYKIFENLGSAPPPPRIRPRVLCCMMNSKAKHRNFILPTASHERNLIARRWVNAEVWQSIDQHLQLMVRVNVDLFPLFSSGYES